MGDINNITLKNNVFYDNETSINLVTVDTVDNVNIINNTIFDSINYASQIYIEPSVAVINSNIVNNIIKRESGEIGIGVYIKAFTAVNCIVDYNCINGYFWQYKGEEDDMSLPGANDFDSDPLFIDTLNADFKLQDLSPCLDSGAGSGTVSDVPSDDIDGISRPIDLSRVSNTDDGTDIGAYESDTDAISSYLDTGNIIDISSGDVSSNSILEESIVEAYSSVSGNPAFDSSSKWNKAIIFYEHSNGQKVRFIHEYRSGNKWRAIAIFLDSLSAGTFEKKRIILLDKTGNRMGVERAEIGTLEDLTITI